MVPDLAAASRVVLLRTRADWIVLTAAWIVVVCAVSLICASVIYGDAVATAGLRRLLVDAPTVQRNVEVVARTAPSVADDVDATVRNAASEALDPLPVAIVGVGRSESLALPMAGDDGEPDLTVLGYFDGLAEHARIVEGAWPAPGGDPVEVAIPVSVSERIGLAVGDSLELTGRRNEELAVRVAVVGRYEVGNADDPFWLDDPLDTTGVFEGESFTTVGPLVVDRADLLARAGDRIDLAWRLFPEFDELRADDLSRLRRSAETLEGRFTGAVGELEDVQVRTDLERLLAEAERSLLVNRSGVLLLIAQIGLLGAYALLMVAGLLVEQRRNEGSLLRSRGATPAHLLTMTLLESLLLVVPAAVIGPLVGLLVVQVLGAAGPPSEIGLVLEARVTDEARLVALFAAAGALVALVTPAITTVVPLSALRRARARPSTRGVAQRIGFDMVLLVAAGVGLWQLRQYGAPITANVRGTVGIDPLLVAAPAIGLVAGSLFALRVVPMLTRVTEGLVAHRGGTVSSLGARQLSRRPGRAARAALLLMLAASLAIFASAYGDTWSASQLDQADQFAGADLRVRSAQGARVPAWAHEGLYAATDGVETAMPVVRERFDVGGALNSGETVAVDAGDAPAVVHFRDDLVARPLAELAALLEAQPLAGTVSIPGQPVTLVVDADLHAEATDASTGEIPAGWRGLTVSAVMQDRTGVLHRFDGERTSLVGDGVRMFEIALTREVPGAGLVTPAYPLTLVAVEFRILAPQGVELTGRIAVERLAQVTPEQPQIESAEAIALPGGPDAWRFVKWDAFTPPAPVEGAGGQVTDFGPITGSAGFEETVLALQAPSLAGQGDRALPAIVNERFVDETGVAVGADVSVSSLADRRVIRVVETVVAFPTIDRETPAVVVDVGQLGLADYATRGEVAFIDEWWLSLDESADADVAAGLRDPPLSSSEVISRTAVLDDLARDPLSLGVIGALVLGSLTAAVCASIGFALSVAAAARERLAEFALMRALGLSAAQLSAWLSIETAFLLIVGLVAGTGLGVVVAWVVLPFVTLTQEATTVFPPPRVVVPWGAMVAVAAFGMTALIATVATLGVVMRRIAVSGVLRGGAE